MSLHLSASLASLQRAWRTRLCPFSCHELRRFLSNPSLRREAALRGRARHRLPLTIGKTIIQIFMIKIRVKCVSYFWMIYLYFFIVWAQKRRGIFYGYKWDVGTWIIFFHASILFIYALSKTRLIFFTATHHSSTRKKKNTSPKGLYRQRLVNMNDEHGAQLEEDKAQACT